MYLPVIDFITLVFCLSLLLMVFNVNRGLNLLILSEVCWACLFVCYVVHGLLFTSLVAYTQAFFLLIFAAVDCSLWVLFLVYHMVHTGGREFNDFRGLRFIFRTTRLMRMNRFIK